jgi:hypothetical protein
MSFMKNLFLPVLLLVLFNFTLPAQDQTDLKTEKEQEYNFDFLQSINLHSFDSGFVKSHFTASISKLDKLRYPPVKDYEMLCNRINSFKVDLDGFDVAYRKIKLLPSFTEGHIFILPFEYKNRVDTVFAYFKPALNKDAKKTGINMIPGSGINQSSAMFYSLRNNTQKNIDDFAQKYGDVYILVKPNEDFLAIHNGIKKIDEVAFVDHLLNHGSSYSAYYLIQSLALSKYIRSRYEQLYVFGHSQGGSAAVINSLQCYPDKAVIASGYSALMDLPYMSGFNQIIIPGYSKNFTSKYVKKQIKEMRTQFLFTWGQQETGIYGVEGRQKLTAKYFADLPNVKCHVHSKGHVYHDLVIADFLEGKM